MGWLNARGEEEAIGGSRDAEEGGKEPAERQGSPHKRREGDGPIAVQLLVQARSRLIPVEPFAAANGRRTWC